MRNLRKFLACAGLALVFAATASASSHAEVVLKRGNGAEPESLDPAISTGVPESFIQMDIFEGLVHPGPDGTLRPGVAESWEISDDGLTYVFKLRPDAVWSDGTPLTAGDFVYSWSRMVDPATASNYAFILWPITDAERITKGELPKERIGAQAVDDRTLKVTLRSPTPYFLQMLMHHSAYPVPRQAIEKFGREWTRPGNIVSNGAYMIQEWVPQGHIKAVRNPRFRDAAEVRIDTVFYYPVEEYGTELKQFRAGELHTTYDVPQEQIPMLEKDMAGQFRNSPYFGTYYYGINVTREPFKSNVRLRHALAMALDRDILVKQITKGGEIPAYGWVPPGVPGYQQQQVEWAGTDQKARVAEAKKILAEAGFDMRRYHEESFDFAALAEAQPDAAAASAVVPVPPPEAVARTFRVEFAKTGRVIECDAGTSILTAARVAGMRLPSSCTKGLCGTCKSKLVAGTVDMKHGGGIRQREIDAGQVLLCCSKPTSDVVVDR